MVSLEVEDLAANTFSCIVSGSSEVLNSNNAEILTKSQTVGKARNRRKTRKLQRFLKCKAFLQQRKMLSTIEVGTQEVLKGKCSVMNGNDQRFCEQTADMEMGSKIKTLLGPLPVVPNCSIVSHNPSTFEDDGGFSVASSSSSSRASSPLAWLKPGKCVAIDCEMVGTGPGGSIGELARCSIVNYRGDVVYDKYINPELPIKNYRTRWSGITKHNLKNAIPFKTAQKEILKILKDKRVVGHALHNDFKALKYFHPSSQTRDTSKIPLLKEIAGLPSNNGVSLKTLAFNLLGKSIQVGSNGHCSVEDAQACLELYKLVEDQWEETLRCCSEISTSTSPETSEVSDNEHYMDDQYWPADLNGDSK